MQNNDSMSEIPNSMIFQNKADQYVTGRMGYPDEVFELIFSFVPSSKNIYVADIGSGTGIFSEELLKRNYETYCVESSEAMRRKAEAKLCRYSGFHSVGALAEQTGLPDNCVDIITVASAFHWFHTEKFRAECQRILKRDGLVCIINNARRHDEFTKAQHEVCKRFCPSFTSINHGAEYTKSVLPKFFQSPFIEKTFSNNFIYTNEQFLARCISSSYSLNQKDVNYPFYCDALKDVINSFSENGKILVRNQTIVWFGNVHRK